MFSELDLALNHLTAEHRWLDLFTKVPKGETELPIVTILRFLSTLNPTQSRHILQMIEKTANAELNKLDEKTQEQVGQYLTTRFTGRVPPNTKELNLVVMFDPNMNGECVGHEDFWLEKIKRLLGDEREFRRIKAEVGLFHPEVYPEVKMVAQQIIDGPRPTFVADLERLVLTVVHHGPVVMRSALYPDFVVSPGELGVVTVMDIFSAIEANTPVTLVLCFGHTGYEGDMPIITFYYDLTLFSPRDAVPVR